MMDRLTAYLSKLAYRALALGGIRVPMALLMQMSKKNSTPAVVEVPDAKRVLVLAPHMDDETIGCGGALREHVLAGAEVHVVFITDGSLGFERQELSRLSMEERCKVRQAEARLACQILGIPNLHFLNLPDGKSQADTESTESLAKIFRSLSPDVVYLPFLTDTHYDHRTTNQLLVTVAKSESLSSSLTVCGYEVWTPLHPNCIVDITAHMEDKMQALGCYKSQLAMNDYLSSVRGLNAYRSISNRSQGYAEAFYRTSLADYLKLASLI